MAASSIAVDQDHFTCSICFDLLTEPVTIPFGHSYCMACIKTYWNDDKRVHSCPQCRHGFTTVPHLGKNTVLAEVVEKFKKMADQTPHPHPLAVCSAEPGDVVECDACTGAKDKAIKSCLVCLASYCELHLQPHLLSSAFQRHKLVDATGKLQQKLCPQHNRLLEIYCRTDRQCICYQCMMDDHKGHDSILPEAERTEREELCKTQERVLKSIGEKESSVQDLARTMITLTNSALAATEDTDSIFSELIQALERGRCEVKEMIRDQDMVVGSQAEGVRRKLEQEIAELRVTLSELEKLAHTQDHIFFLQGFDRLPACKALRDNTNIALNTYTSFGCVTASVTNLKDKLINVCRKELRNITTIVNQVRLIEGKWIRAELLQVACQPTLDPNTANKTLCLSEGNTKVTGGSLIRLSKDNSERFDVRPQVLCQEAMRGRHYWEAEWTERHGLCIGVSYREISRKGKGHESGLGHNDKSWTLSLSSKAHSFWHNNMETALSLPTNVKSGRVGVYLDYKAGMLSFFSVSDTLNVLHTVKTTFDHVLYPGFAVGTNSVVRMCPLNLDTNDLQSSSNTR
ncbi:tripartite motif-containing protein 16-like isoform X2 [Sardina pilchardus]|uniref:tripartite motif-containing protein 16-like isoform X2 n=1 Tax=Sardina pilchardus TaxID=27697 RepID=UPI002E11A517